MTEEIKQFDTWLNKAQPGDRYTYFIGNLAHSAGLIDGYPLRQLREHIMNICCKWNLDQSSIDNRIKFKPFIRLVQKAQKKYWDERTKDVLHSCDYMAVKI